MSLPQSIKSFAARNGCIAGICDAAPLAREPYATGFTPFVNNDLDKRTDPAATLPGVKSIIAVGVGWKPDDVGDITDASRRMGQLSSLGCCNDYHKSIKNILIDLINEIKININGDFKYRILIDSPDLDERAFAVRAGLGFYGRNGLVVSQAFGSRFNIGLILTDISSHPADASPPGSIKGCPPDCRRCIDACPTNALKTNNAFDTSRCISYLTQKNELTPEEEALLGNQLYGCDICQDACPFNAPCGKKYINPADWLDKSDVDYFKQAYGNTAMLWKGADILRRNAQAVNNNIQTPKGNPHDR
jgi:epoxyqueuosine reductase